MKPKMENNQACSTAGMLSLGLGAGAVLMYFADPRTGKRRRALMRDQLVRMRRIFSEAAATTAHDMSNRLEGLVASARHRLTTDTPTDERLAERVRAKLGRTGNHASAIEVNARNGVITLSGPALENELQSILADAGATRGVTEVRNELQVHREAGDIPSLQGVTTPAPMIHGTSLDQSGRDKLSLRGSKASHSRQGDAGPYRTRPADTGHRQQALQRDRPRRKSGFTTDP
jgi:hypothetical protein